MTIMSKITEIFSIQQYPQMTIIFKNIENNKNNHKILKIAK